MRIIFTIAILFIALLSSTDKKNKVEYKEVLHIPTGEILKIRINKFHRMLGKNIKWSDKYNMFIKKI